MLLLTFVERAENLQTAIYLISTALLLIAAYIVFNRVVAQEYKNNGRLGWWASTLQFLIFVAFFCFPYLYMPPELSLRGGWSIRRTRRGLLWLPGPRLAYGRTPCLLYYGKGRCWGFLVRSYVIGFSLSRLTG